MRNVKVWRKKPVLQLGIQVKVRSQAEPLAGAHLRPLVAVKRRLPKRRRRLPLGLVDDRGYANDCLCLLFLFLLFRNSKGLERVLF